MKKLSIFLVAFIIALGAGSFAQTIDAGSIQSYTAPTYNLKPVFGNNAQVVGPTVAAVKGSVAISDGDYLALVDSVMDACQIGAGVNSTAGTLQYRDATVPTIAVDTNVTTDVTLVTAATGGQILVGGAGVGTNAVWVSTAAGTNGWVKIAELP